MYRFLLRPKWIGFHLLVLAAIVAMINLGFWQLRRLDQRQAFNATIEQRYDEPPVPLDDLLSTVTGDEYSQLEWYPVSASGTYLSDEQFREVNRSQGGRAGDNIVTPMRLADGRVLIVNRGFVPLTFDAPPAPSGTVEIIGRLRVSQEKRLGQLGDAAEGDLDLVQRIDIPRLTPQLPGDVVPMYVDLQVSDPAEQPGLPDPVAAPELGEGNHLSYAVQWFIFTIAVGVGWVLAVKRSVRTRQRAARKAAKLAAAAELDTENAMNDPAATGA
jgi:cytochrome oxidase assembly protein ShyY1